MKLLIVDDDEQNRYMLQVLLEGHDHQVASASDGVEALEMARRDPPDLIVSDILMPTMDGFALCRECKKDAMLKGIPFVFYTATYTDPKDEAFALSLGAERFIVKPQEPDAFVDIVREILEGHEASQPVAPREVVEEEGVFFRQYNEVLIRKLEDKLLQLEQANQALEREVAEHRQAEQELRTYRDHLEEVVSKRTAELRKLVNAMTGRELRMAELKGVIRKLRAQLEEAGLKPVADDPLLGEDS